MRPKVRQQIMPKQAAVLVLLIVKSERTSCDQMTSFQTDGRVQKSRMIIIKFSQGRFVALIL